MENRHISLFKGYSDTEPASASLEEVVHLIKGDTALRDRTNKHRYYLRQNLKREADREKSGCPCFAVAVRFEGGKSRKDVQAWTGYTLVDLDHIESGRMAATLAAVCTDSHTLMAYTTISGQGIRVICRIENLNLLGQTTAYRHYTRCFNHVNNHYGRLVGFPSDGQCKNATRLSGLASDPNVYYNPEAETFALLPTSPKNTPQGGGKAEALLPNTPQGSGKAEAPFPNTPKGGKAKRNRRLERAVRASETSLEQEGVSYCEHRHNEYVMRMGYLLNRYGVGQKTATAWAVERFADYDGNVAAIFESCYKNTDEHGTRSVSNRTGEGEDKFVTVEEIEQFLSGQAKFRKNVISGKIEMQAAGDRKSEMAADSGGGEYVELTDRCINTLWSRMNKEGRPVRLTDMRTVIDSEYTPLFNPFTHYMENLAAWDGTTDHIARLAASVRVKGEQERFGTYFKKWLVALIASLLDPRVVNHEILVFIGKQGIYKTTWMQRLLPTRLQRYFYVKNNSGRINKDDLFTLTEFALVCLEELEDLSSTQVSQLKAITAMETVNERAAYGHFKESRPHIASFCGTSNHTTFLNDLSGNRRWLPFEVEQIESPFERTIDYDGVYAQGYALWKGGFRYWFNPEEVESVNLYNRHFEVPCLERELVQVYFRRPRPGEECDFLTNAQVLGRINIGLRQPLSATRLGMVMKQEGYETIRFKQRRGYRVVQLSDEQVQHNQKAMARYVVEE